jgi:dipeptidyl aminopeptidase/acylaminoacyl peptidase
MAGTYDLLRIWEHDRVARPVGDVPTESFIGGTPMSHRRAYHEGSPLFHASTENAHGTSWLLAWGTEDDVVPPDQSLALSAALKRAGALVRHVPIVGAPHYWYLENGPTDRGSSSEFVARRVEPFLAAWRDR